MLTHLEIACGEDPITADDIERSTNLGFARRLASPSPPVARARGLAKADDADPLEAAIRRAYEEAPGKGTTGRIERARLSALLHLSGGNQSRAARSPARAGRRSAGRCARSSTGATTTRTRPPPGKRARRCRKARPCASR
ncbi:MAG TPA: hypothetical protein VHB21_08410, partial [Minicystis sp.]|nr:hypothetical protein [Minicystis sp.]